MSVHADFRYVADQPLSVLLDALASTTNPAPAIVEGYLAPFNAIACMVHARREGMLILTAATGFPADVVAHYERMSEQARLPMATVIREGAEEWLSSLNLASSYPLASAQAHALPPAGVMSFHAIHRAGVPIGSLGIGYADEPPRSEDLARRIDALTRALSLWLDTPVDAQPTIRSGSSEVTERQREILAQLCDHRTNRQIADSLGVSVATIKAELSHLFRLLGTRRRSELPARAIRAGI